MKILQLNSSIRGDDGISTRLAASIAKRLCSLDPSSEVTVRDLGHQPVLDAAAYAALITPPEKRSREQAERMAKDDGTVAELLQADAVILGVPLYNLGVPVQLKAWIDAVCRAGATFRYTADGPEGLVKGKKVYVALARGGVYRDTPADTQKPYLETILGFLGMTDVTFVHAEGLAISPDDAARAIDAAEAEISRLV